MDFIPANLATKLYLKDELKIKILSKFLFFNSFVNLKMPFTPMPAPKCPACKTSVFPAEAVSNIEAKFYYK